MCGQPLLKNVRFPQSCVLSPLLCNLLTHDYIQFKSLNQVCRRHDISGSHQQWRPNNLHQYGYMVQSLSKCGKGNSADGQSSVTLRTITPSLQVNSFRETAKSMGFNRLKNSVIQKARKESWTPFLFSLGLHPSPPTVHPHQGIQRGLDFDTYNKIDSTFFQPWM